MIHDIIQFFATLDTRLAAIAQASPATFFAIVAAIIFAETGLVVFPLLPGDSLLFIAGAVTALAGLNVHLFVLVLIAAAVLGDSVNYFIGRNLGEKAFSNHDSKIFKPAYLERTQAFYDKYGTFAVVMGRFVPIVRTFVPFMAGVSHMRYRTFLPFSIFGGALWISSITYAGYFFGNIEWAKKNISLIVIGIVLLSVAPLVIKYLQERSAARAGK